MTSSARPYRRSLREALKTILPRRRDDRDDRDSQLTIPSTSSGRKPASLVHLPTISSLSSLPDFDSSSFDIDRYSVSTLSHHDRMPARVWAADYSRQTIVPYSPSNPDQDQCEFIEAYQCQSQLGELAKTCSTDSDWDSNESVDDFVFSQPGEQLSRETLVSKTSSCQAVTPESIHFQSPLSQLAHACNVPSVYRYGASLQASLATLRSPVQSASTLRLQRSRQDLPKCLEAPSARPPKRVISIKSAAPAPVASVMPEQERLPKDTSRTSAPATPISHPSLKPPHRSRRDAEIDAGLSSIAHFSSFCVLDAASPGCPVTATSQDLRLVFDIGEDFCLDTVGIDGASMDTVTGQDADGNAVIHLVIYTRLVNPNSGRSRFVLASLLDITSFITGAASLPELDTISEESVTDERVNTPPGFAIGRSPRYKVSADSLLQECQVPDHRTPLGCKESDIWLDIASEETRRTRSSTRSSPSTPRSCSSTTTSSTRSMDGILDQFLTSLQLLYSEFFVLGKSPLDENTYEICNVSPKVHDSREYIEGHLSRTSPSDKTYLERALTQEESFRMRVRWGAAGELKQLFCVPLFGRSNVTWVCFLVQEDKWAGLPIWE